MNRENALNELKASAFDAMKQVELWTVRARELNQKIEQMEAAPVNGKVDTPAPLDEITK